jgi:luciferase family oxidoreductase group 1
MKFPIGILDQSIILKGKTPREALEETIATARLAESLGYSRFWVSEHHNSAFIAGSAPEILMVKLADATSNIRIGSGGIMLPNHSALKVAENFRLLETLFPGRIDLGMGRAPGGDRITAMLLNPSNHFTEREYEQQLTHLQHFFRDEAGTEHGKIIAAPQAATVPEQWILSSSGGSSLTAAKFGMGLAVARFINGQVQPEVVKQYRKNFVPSEGFPEPAVILSLAVLCAEDEVTAARMRKHYDYVILQFERGNFSAFGDTERSKDYVFSPEERERIRYNSGRVVSGTPKQVKQQLEKLVLDFDADELMITTMSFDGGLRKRSFELVAEVLL